MRGSAKDSSRSRNSHIRSPRNVTWAPIGMPSRSLNCAMDLRALVTVGFWPVIAVRSLTAPSISLESRAASPTPMLTTILVSPGTCMMLAISNSLVSAGMISSRYRSFSRGWTLVLVSVSVISDFLARLARDANAALGGVGRAVRATLGHLVAAEADAGHTLALDQ